VTVSAVLVDTSTATGIVVGVIPDGSVHSKRRRRTAGWS
jgi:hypothetical protein